MSDTQSKLATDAVLPDDLIAPFERLRLPPHLDGSLYPHNFPSVGTKRFEAANDLEAIQAWLTAVTATPGTFKSYLLNAERCLLWATVERGKPLCALNERDATTYSHFLLTLSPRERWLNSGYCRRTDKGWRPFQVPMSVGSRDRTIGVLASMWDWLSDHGYAHHNPWRSTIYALNKPEKRTLAPGISTDANINVVTFLEWTYIERALKEIDSVASENSSIIRTTAIFYLAYFADMKPGEIASLRVSDLRRIDGGTVPVWILSVPDRAPLQREIVLMPPAQQALEGYLESHGVASDVSGHSGSDILLFASVRRESRMESNMTRSTMASRTKPVFMRASEMARAGGDGLAAHRLASASLQWLKHAFEIHIAHHGPPGNWSWLLLGSWWLVPSGFRDYVRARPKLTIDRIYEAFEALRPMWQLD